MLNCGVLFKYLIEEIFEFGLFFCAFDEGDCLLEHWNYLFTNYSCLNIDLIYVDFL